MAFNTKIHSCAQRIGGFSMKNKKLVWIIGIVSAVAAISAALTAFFIVKDKQKKDDEELMEYLDSSIE